MRLSDEQQVIPQIPRRNLPVIAQVTHSRAFGAGFLP
jgi:hypothetical protein